MYALRVFGLRIDAPDNSKTRLRVFGPAAAIMADNVNSARTATAVPVMHHQLERQCKDHRASDRMKN